MFESSLSADAIFIKWVPWLFSLGIHMMKHKHMLENVDKRRGRTFIPPFDHPDVITGQGIIGMEIMRQLQGPVHAIFVPVRGGGLIVGIAVYVKRVSPKVRVALAVMDIS